MGRLTAADGFYHLLQTNIVVVLQSKVAKANVFFEKALQRKDKNSIKKLHQFFSRSEVRKKSP